MTNKLVLFILLLLLSASVNGQSYKNHIPDDLHIAKDWNDSELIYESDFNKDAKKDYFIVLNNIEGATFFLSLISKGNRLVQNALVSTGDFYCCSSINIKPKNVIEINSKGNRYFQSYKIRWDETKAQFRIIGFDDHDLPSHTGNSTKNSFNFYTRQLIRTMGHNDFETGKYTSREIKRSFKNVGKYYLNEFEACSDMIDKTILR